jgi:hypothetical protein
MQKISKRSQPENAVSSMQRLDLWRSFDLRAAKNEPNSEQDRGHGPQDGRVSRGDLVRRIVPGMRVPGATLIRGM